MLRAISSRHQLRVRSATEDMAMARVPPELEWAGVHVTGADLNDAGAPVTESEVVDALGRISVYDCIWMLGQLSACLVLADERFSQATQRKLIDYLAADSPELRHRLHACLNRGQIAVFEQQLYHLSRLALLHADLRPADAFDNGEVASDFLLALFGVTDQFDHDLGIGPIKENIVRLELRQAAMGHNEERLTQWSFYYELFDRIWPQLDKAPDADEAFCRYTGVTITEYLALGFAFSAGFQQDRNGWPLAKFDPARWFNNLTLEESTWRSFLARSGASVENLRNRLLAEQEELGETNYQSLVIEKTPILEGLDGQIYVINFAALERRATHGIFHILAEDAEAEGLDRETFTAPFGAAFQRWAEESVHRMEGKREEPTIFADVPYGPKQKRRDTPDVVLRYERQIVAVEGVAGALQIKTSTHGDLTTFDQDLEKLVFKKASQLTKRIADIKDGETAGIGLTAEGVTRFWPVIVTAAPFPVRSEIMKKIRRELKDRELLLGKDVGPISIISAEDLAGLEAYVETSEDSILKVISGWKSHRRTGDHYLKNYLWQQQQGTTRPPAHHAEMFDAATSEMLKFLFGDQAPEPESAR